VHQLRGNPSKKNLAALTDSLQPEIEIPNCPAHLLKEAKAEWKYITPLLKKYGLISKLDRAAISSYCQAWALVVFSDVCLKRDIEKAEKARAEAEKAGIEYTGGDGLTLVTSNGNVIYNPHYSIGKSNRQLLDRMLANFGMSPAARGRVSPSNRLQHDLFDDEPSGKASGFGGL
jgi:P27 family predicted phage terminase small subunit